MRCYCSGLSQLVTHCAGDACFKTGVTIASVSLKWYHHSMQAWLLTQCVVLVGYCWVWQQLNGRLYSWLRGAGGSLDHVQMRSGVEWQELIWNQQAGGATSEV